jgi:hypothetical protein
MELTAKMRLLQSQRKCTADTWFTAKDHSDIISAMDSTLKGAQDPSLAVKHLTTTSLSNLINKHQKLDDPSQFKALFWNSDRWKLCLDVYLSNFDVVKGKLIRSLLSGILGSLLASGEDAKDLGLELLDHLLDPIKAPGNRQKVKAALFAIQNLLNAKTITPHDIFQVYDHRINETLACDKFLQRVFHWATFQEITPAAGKMLGDFNRICIADSVFGNLSHGLWVEPMLDVLKESPDALYKFKTQIFPKVFSQSAPDFYAFLIRVGIDRHMVAEVMSSPATQERGDKAERAILFAALQCGKETGLVLEKDELERVSADEFAVLKDDAVLLKTSAISDLLFDINWTVRLSGFSILVASPASTRPFSDMALALLAKALPSLAMETDAGVRQDTLALFSSLIDRLKACMFKLSQIAKPGGDDKHDSDIEDDEDKPDKKKDSRPTKKDRKAAKEDLEMHQEFMGLLVKFIILELKPGSGYARHVFALKALQILIKSGLNPALAPSTASATERSSAVWPLPILFDGPHFERLIQDLVMNSFEDIRSLAANVLENYYVSSGVSDPSAVNEYFDKAREKMTLSGRADHADGVARLYRIQAAIARTSSKASSGEGIKLDDRYWVIKGLIEDLQAAIAVGKGNLPLAMEKHPIHGILASLRHIIDAQGFYTIAIDEGTFPDMDPKATDVELGFDTDLTHRNRFNRWHVVHLNILNAIRSIWHIVKDTLCNDAPEGHVPEDLEDAADVDTKDLGSYCWRALKEASLLMGVIANKVYMSEKTAESRNSMLDSEDLFKMASFTFQCLTMLRHRGAFSAVAQAFAACSLRLQKEKQTKDLDTLFTKAFEIIEESGSTTTRRSAGIPSIMIGIVCADPEGPRFKKAIERLQQVATTKLPGKTTKSLPQVHALNCLKSIFTTSSLGTYCEPYVASTITLAGNSLTSEVWAIRNCGLMLFRALIDRLLGSHETQNWTAPPGEDPDKKRKAPKLSWESYPTLQKVILELLASPVADIHTGNLSSEIVFPALKLIQSVPPPESMKQQVKQKVLIHSGSAHWHVRDMAARAYAALYSPADVFGTAFAGLFYDIEDKPTNEMHGKLLCAKYMLEKYIGGIGTKDPAIEFPVVRMRVLWTVLQEQRANLLHGSNCSFIQAGYLELLVQILHCLCIRLSLGIRHPEFFWEFAILIDHDIATLSFDGEESAPLLRKHFALVKLLGESIHTSCKWQFLSTGSTPLPVPESFSGVSLIALAPSDLDACAWVFESLLALDGDLPLHPAFIEQQLFPDLHLMIVDNELGSVMPVSERLLLKFIDKIGADFQEWHRYSYKPWKEMFLLEKELAPGRMETILKLWAKFFIWNLAQGGGGVDDDQVGEKALQETMLFLEVIGQNLDETKVSISI